MITMLRFIFIIVSLLMAVPVGFCEADATVTRSLSLDQAIETVFHNNKDIQAQEYEVKAANAGILGARSGFLPKLTANAGYTRNGNVLSQPQAAGAKKDSGIFTGYKNDNKLGVELTQSIYSAGANTSNLRQEQIGLMIQMETLRARKLDAEFEAKRLYNGLLLAQENERIAQALLDQSKSHYEEVKQKYDQGTASRFDLLQSKVQVSKIMPELIKAKNATELILAQLKKILGFKMSDALTLSGSLSYDLIEVSENEFLKAAYLEKPEMMLMALGVDVGKWSIAMAKSGYGPRVNVSAGYNYRSNDTGDMFNDRHSNWSAGISVSVPIFDGFSTKAKVDGARARYAQAQLNKDNLSDQIAVDIRKACLDLQRAQAIIDSQKDNIEEAREAVKIAQVRYDNGEGTNLDVLDAQISLSQVSKNLSEGIYDYLMAQAFLDRTMGKSRIKEAMNEKTN